MTTIRFFLVFTVLALAGVGVLRVLEVINSDQMFDIGGKTVLVLVILGGAGLAIGRIGPKDPGTSDNESTKQGPRF